MTRDIKILVVDADKSEELRCKLEESYQCEICPTGKEAISKFNGFKPNVVIVDAGIPDMPFTELLAQLRDKDKNIIRIVTSVDFGKVDKIIDAVNEAHYYFSKPLNYPELKKVIDAKCVNYNVVKVSKLNTVDAEAAFKKMKTIFDQVKEADELKEQSLVQLEKSRRMETENFDRIKRLNALEKLVGDMKEKDRQSEESKRQLQEQLDAVLKEKNKIKEEIEIFLESTKAATLSVSSNLKKMNRMRKNEKDSILIVDDEDDIRALFEESFEGQYNVYLAKNSEIALKMLQENPDICLVVTDQQMPKIVGTELAANIHKRYPTMPVFLLTGHANIDMAIKSLNDGHITKYFRKPIEMNDLKNEIDLGIEKFDISTSEQEILSEKKAFIVEQIRDLTVRFETLRQDQKILQEENNRFKAQEAQRNNEVEQIRKENNQMKESVAKERAAMIAEVENVLEIQRQKNKEALALMKQEFNEEKKRVEDEIEKARRSVADVHAEIERQFKAELENKKKAAQEQIEKMRAMVTRDLDKLRESSLKKERELTELATQSQRAVKERDDEIILLKRRADGLEREIEKSRADKNEVARQMDAMKAEYEFVLQSRAALEAELAERKK